MAAAAPAGRRAIVFSAMTLPFAKARAGRRNAVPRAFRPLAPAFAALVLCGCSSAPPSHTLTIAAAADLKFAMDDLSRVFHRSHSGIAVRASYGSSGDLYAQIRNGAPFDLFLSADLNYPGLLAREGIGAKDGPFAYAVGHIVVWVPAQSKLDPAAALREPSIRRFAIANPRHAPYGRAAEAALRSLGLYDALKDRLTLGQNVAQTLAFIQSGAAEAGIVSLSLALAPGVRNAGRYWQIPTSAYPRLEQGGLILRDSAAARDFRAFLLGPEGQGILKQYGFFAPQPAGTPSETP